MSLKSVKTLTATQLAKKWNLSLTEIAKLIDQGAKVEREHTKSDKEAREIARDHIGEKPDYYKKLKKIEESGTVGVRGLGNVTGDPSGTNYVQMYIDSNSMSYQDENGNNFKWIRKHTKGHNKVGFKDYDPRKLKEGISAGPEREVDYSIGDPTGSSRKVAKVVEQGTPGHPRYTERPMYEKKLDELKAETLGSYIKKASESRKKSLVGPKPNVKTWGKREHGIRTAIKQLTREEQNKPDLKLMGNQKPDAFDYGAKGTTKTIHEETKMDTKEVINEALDNILENNLVAMKENLLTVLQEKAMEKLEEKRKEIASNYFAQ